jgi:phage I-like protein
MLALKKETAVTTKSQSPPPQTGDQGEDFSSRYFESTQETLVGLYSKRDSKTGKPVETVNEIVHRVASAVALAELKYILRPDEIVAISLERALSNGRVAQWKKEFAESIGKQKFWANTPANINADPDSSLILKRTRSGCAPKNSGLPMNPTQASPRLCQNSNWQWGASSANYAAKVVWRPVELLT